MNSAGQTQLAASSASALRIAASAADRLARPEAQRRIRLVLMILLGVWIAASLWRAVLSFIPEAPPVPATDIINPMTPSTAATPRSAVDPQVLAAAPLFGEPGDAAVETLELASGRSPAMSESEAAEALAGIEDGAPETRLPLRLSGVVAASQAGLGQAVIEHQNRQDLYQVGDELPVSGNVVLAKVLPTLVVLENTGRYETLKLFEESELRRQVVTAAQGAAPAPRPAVREPAPEPQAAGTGESAAPDPARIAATYRERLYADPESLADVVLVSAVRQDGALRGYRVQPGRAADEFAALGFEAGDVVTAINGLSLAEPANTVRLYQLMRSATAASFDIERGGERVTLEVALGAPNGARR